MYIKLNKEMPQSGCGVFTAPWMEIHCHQVCHVGLFSHLPYFNQHFIKFSLVFLFLHVQTHWYQQRQLLCCCSLFPGFSEQLKQMNENWRNAKGAWVTNQVYAQWLKMQTAPNACVHTQAFAECSISTESTATLPAPWTEQWAGLPPLLAFFSTTAQIHDTW